MSPTFAIAAEGARGLFGFPLPDGLIEAGGLVLARTSAMLLATPLLGTGASFYGYKVSLVVAVSVAMVLSQGIALVEDLSWCHFGVLALRELVEGVGLALVLHLVVMAVRVGSEMVGNEMAFTMANSVDPASGESMPLLSRMNESLFFLALLSVDGHHWILRALAESWERAPLGEIVFSAGLPGTLIEIFSDLFSAGISFAAPILVLLAMVSITIGLIARAVPQVNVLEMGFSLRVGGGLAAIGLLSPTLAPAMETLLERFMAGLETGLDAL
ncbi:MAG: flagellar biosynthetic protein FliR [Planctomycetota bacterium]